MKKILSLAALLFVTGLAVASHLRCGYITAVRENCNTRAYTITITVFTNTASEVKFGEDGILDFGDGTSMIIPRIENIGRPDLGPNIGLATYSVSHVYSASASYLISYSEPNRNGGVLNMSDSFFTPFYTETLIDLSQCSTPTFIAPPIFVGGTQNMFDLSLGAKSSEDSQITYELAVPFKDRGTPVTGFIPAENMTLNYLTGLITWNTDVASPGEYNFAVNAVQWKNVNGTLLRSQYVRVDFQVILNGEVPFYAIQDNQELDGYNRILAPAGEEKTIKVFFETDAANQPKLEMYSALPEEAVSFVTYDSVSSSNGSDIKVGVLKIISREQDLRTTGYIITVRGRSLFGSTDINYLVFAANELPPLPVITATENDLADIQIFPNPVQNFVNIELNSPGLAHIQLYSQQGTLIKTHSFEARTTVALTGLPPGVYVCDVQRNNRTIKKIKLIKAD